MDIDKIRQLAGKDVVVINVNSDTNISELRAAIKAGNPENHAFLIVCGEPDEIQSKSTNETPQDLSRLEPFVLRNIELEELPEDVCERNYSKKHRGHERPYKYHR